MRFTLTYDGKLPAASKADPRAHLKHKMRQNFHAQLSELWQERLSLRRALLHYQQAPLPASVRPGPVPMFAPADIVRTAERLIDRLDDSHRGRSYRAPHESALRTMGRAIEEGILIPFERGAFTFVPLVTRHFELTCDLDILFLRAEQPGSLFPNSKGDLDNRLKVLFDALTMLEHPNQLPDAMVPEESERPFFCLLEDDKLITSFRVKSERLLDRGPDDVKLIIEVTVRTQRVNFVTMEIQGD